MPFVLAPFAAYAVHAVCNAYGGAIAYLPSFARGVVEPRVAFLRTDHPLTAALEDAGWRVVATSDEVELLEAPSGW